MYRKGPRAYNLSGLDENRFYTYPDRVGFLPEETYFFQDNGRNMVSSVFFHFLPEEMEEWDL